MKLSAPTVTNPPREQRTFATIATGLAASLTVLAIAPVPAAAAVSTTPVWIGSAFSGTYGSEGTQPGSHGGSQVSFDFFAPAGTPVKIFAAPKNNALNNSITTHIVATGWSSTNSAADSPARCGYFARVEIRHSGNPIGLISFHHLASQPSLGAVSRWGGTIGSIGNLPVNSGAPCYQVVNAAGRHSHIEFRSYGSRPACAHDFGQVSRSAGAYQGYVGDYGKAPLAGNRCPNGI